MLAMRPRVLVLDEPTASLDPAGKTAVFKVLQDLRRQHEITILMATQELERINRLADRVLVLHDGQIALQGRTRQDISGSTGPPPDAHRRAPGS